MASIKAQMLSARMESEPALLVVDVREPDAFAIATIPGAASAPFDDDTAARLAQLLGDRRRPVVFVCAWGHRAAIASIALRRQGFKDVSYLEGGLEAWGCAALPVVPGKQSLRPLPAITIAERARAADP